MPSVAGGTGQEIAPASPASPVPGGVFPITSSIASAAILRANRRRGYANGVGRSTRPLLRQLLLEYLFVFGEVCPISFRIKEGIRLALLPALQFLRHAEHIRMRNEPDIRGQAPQGFQAVGNILGDVGIVFVPGQRDAGAQAESKFPDFAINIERRRRVGGPPRSGRGATSSDCCVRRRARPMILPNARPIS